MILLKNATLYNPSFCGKKDILIDDAGKIVKIGQVDAVGHVIDCSDNIVCPMFVDGHEHISLKQYYTLQGIVDAGVGTVVGVLANEFGQNNVQQNIDIAKELKKFGIDAYCLAGSKVYRQNIYSDIVNNENVVGVKTALNSSTLIKAGNPTYEELKALALETFKAGRDANKKVQVHIHLETEKGDLKHSNLSWIDRIVAETGVNYSLFKLTHAQKYGKPILEYANKGCFLDYTAMSGDYDKRFDFLIESIKNNQIDKSKISISSDLGILNMERGWKEPETPFTLLKTLKLFVEHGLELSDVLPMLTSVPGSLIKDNLGKIEVGQKAKLLVLNKDLEIKYNSFDFRKIIQLSQNQI